jgi:hypothetical protein
MSFVIRALLSIAVAFVAAAAMAMIPGSLVDGLAGIVALLAIVVFMRTIMAFAAEPGEEPRRSDRPR